MYSGLLRGVARASIVVVILSSFLGLTSGKAWAKPVGSEAEWTVLFYTAADNNLEGILVRLMNEVEAIGSTDEVNFVAAVDRHPGYYSGSEDWSDTRYYRLEQDSNLFLLASPVLVALGEPNTGKAETLQEFIEWGISEFPARHYALIISDHGGGWQGASADETSDDQMISPAGMQRAIGDALNNVGTERLDLIVFNACLMAQLEVWSLLAPYADYGVASEEVTYGMDGLPSVMRNLVDDPTMGPEEVGRQLVEAFGDFNGQIERGATLTMSAVQLSELPRLQNAVDELARALAEHLDDAQTILAVAQGAAHAPSFADTDRDFFGMIDLRSLLLIVQKMAKSPEVVHSAQQAQQALEDAVLERFAGQDVPSVGGLSVFFPTLPRILDFYVHGYGDVLEPMPGAEESPWIQFLTQYYEALPEVVETPAIKHLSLAEDTISKGEQARLDVTVSGIGLKEVDLVVGRVEGDVLLTVYSNRMVLNTEEIEKGLTIPVWNPKGNRLLDGWDGTGWVLSNGERQVRAWVEPTVPDGNTLAVPGFIRSVAGGNDLEGELRFSTDAEANEAVYEGAFVRKRSGALGPYEFETGDVFVVKRQIINTSDGALEMEAGGTLVIGKDPPQLLNLPVPAGQYQLGIRAVNLTDEGSLELASLRVEHPIETATYRSRALSIITQYPGDWLVQESVGGVVFTPDELSGVKAQMLVIPLWRLGADLSSNVDTLLGDVLRSKAEDEAVSDVQEGELSEATLAERAARRLDYTYEHLRQGEISGSLVGFIDETTEQLYVSLVEAPSAVLEYEQTNLEMIRENARLLAPIYVRRTYSNETMGFSLAYKDYWQVIERPASGDVFFRTPTLDAALRVQERPGKAQPGPADNDVLIRIYVDDLLSEERNLEISDPADVTLSGLKGRQVVYSYEGSDGQIITGTVSAVTARDGRGYVLNAEIDTRSDQLDILTQDVQDMHASFRIVDPEASPVPNPGDGWQIFESKALHFGVAYLKMLQVEEDLDDPDFPVARFYTEDANTRFDIIEIANVPLSPDVALSSDAADEVVMRYLKEALSRLTETHTGTLSDVELGGLPARGIAYDGLMKIKGDPRSYRFEGTMIVAPTPCGFAYLVNILMPSTFTGGVPVDANVAPHLLATFTPLLDGLTPVTKRTAGSELLRSYENASLGFSISVPINWRISEQEDRVAFVGTDEMGRRVDAYRLTLEDQGSDEPLSSAELDDMLGEAFGEAEQSVRVMESPGEPADANLGGLSGRKLEFVGLKERTELVNYTVYVLQNDAGRLYLVILGIPVAMQVQQQDVLKQVLDSLIFQAS